MESELAEGASGSGKMVAGKVRRRRLYDWDRLFNGEQHQMVAGRDFWTSARNFQSQVAQMAKSRGVEVRTWTDVEQARAKQASKRTVWVVAERDPDSA